MCFAAAGHSRGHRLFMLIESESLGGQIGFGLLDLALDLFGRLGTVVERKHTIQYGPDGVNLWIE